MSTPRSCTGRTTTARSGRANCSCSTPHVETRSLYTADVTRTLPISGTFTPVQRQVYDAVYEAQEAGMAAVKPGAPYRDFHEASQRHMTAQLVEWGFIEGPVDRAYALGLQRRFTMAGTGHMLGLDVHDCAQARTGSTSAACSNRAWCSPSSPASTSSPTT